MNGERRLDTPALISAIVQDVQRAQIGGVDKQEILSEPDCNEADTKPVGQFQANDDQNENNGHLNAVSNNELGNLEPGRIKFTIGSQNSLELEIDSESPVNIHVEQAVPLQADVRKDQTLPTVPISPESPSPVAHVPVAPLTANREVSSPDTKPAKLDFDALLERKDDVEESGFASPWSPGVVEDQPVVYMPPPVVETECDEELEELANVGRKERQVAAIASSHHLSTMYDHHHHHDDLKKHVRDLPLDSEPVRHSCDDKRSHDEISSHRLDHKPAAEPAQGPKPGTLFRVPSILEQMVDEPPAEAGAGRGLFRVPSVLEQMMDEPPKEAADDAANPPEVNEYRLDSAEFASDRQEGSSHSHHALHVPGSAMAVTTCRDLHFRDSEGGFILGDTEIAPAAEGSSFSEASEGGNSDEENQYEFPIDQEEPVKQGLQNSRSSLEDKGMIDEKIITSETSGDNDNKVASNEEGIDRMSVENGKSHSEKIDEIPRIADMFGNPDNNVQFYIGEQHEEMHEYSEPLSSREEKLDNNFYSEGERGKLGEDDNKIDATFETELNAAPERSPDKTLLSQLVATEPRIPSFNDLYNNEEEDRNSAENAADDSDADDYWARDEPGALSNGLDFKGLETGSCESHHRDDLLRPKPPPGRSERGCSSARYVFKIVALNLKHLIPTSHDQLFSVAVLVKISLNHWTNSLVESRERAPKSHTGDIARLFTPADW